MQKLSREDIQQFHKRYYVASNAVIAIVGAVTRQEAETLAQQVIGKLPAGKEAPPLPAVTSLSASRLEQIGFPSQQTHILIGQPGIKRGDPDYFPLYVGNHILGGGGLVSRLSEEIREKRGLSYSTYSYFSPMRMAGPYILGLQTRNDQTAEAHRLMQKVLSEFVAHGPTAEELDAARKNITGGFPLRIASNSKIASYIAMIGFYGLPLDYLDRFNERVEAVTLEQIRDAFQRRVAPDKMLTVIVGGGNLTASADEPAS
jgi:zinc protease